jgi:hypothetical protein
MNCEICFELYNHSKNKPYVLSCGHTFCIECLTALRNYTYICPTCREPISNEIPNYSILGLLINDHNELLKQAISKQFNELESIKTKFHSKYDKELKVSKIITDIFINEQKLEAISKQTKNTLNQMDQNGLTTLINQLDKIKDEMNTKLDILEQLSQEMLVCINIDSLENSKSDDNVCYKCMQKLTGQFTVYEDKKYHLNCFVCCKCNKEFKENIVFEFNKGPLCSDCHMMNQIQTASKCRKCTKPILETIITFKNAEYHDACFTCHTCVKKLNGQSIYSDKNDRHYCMECFTKKEAKICANCFKSILPNQTSLIFLDKHFHEGFSYFFVVSY